jgi:hypothetical protein
MSRDSSVGITTRYELEGPGIESRWGRDFPHPSRPALGPNQLPVQWVPDLCRGVKRSGCDDDQPSPSSEGRLSLKCDGTRAETRFRLSAKRTSPFKSAGASVQSTTGSGVVCASAVVMLDTPWSEVVRRVLATHSIRQFPLHFPSHASPCAITFQLDSNDIDVCPQLKIKLPRNVKYL